MPEIDDKTHNYITLVCMNCGDEHAIGIPCGDRFCFECGKVRKHRIISGVEPLIKNMKTPRFATFTQKSTALTKGSIARIRKNFAKLRRLKIWKGVVGGIYNIEAGSPNGHGLWNIHIHTIYDGPFIPQKALSEAWRSVTMDSYIVDVRNCNSVHGALSYLTKHFVKISSVTEELDRDLANKVLKNTRLIQGYGSLNHIAMVFNSVCPSCGAQNSLISCYDPLFYDVLSAFDGAEYDRQPA